MWAAMKNVTNEFRVPFTSRLTHAEVVPLSAPLPPLVTPLVDLPLKQSAQSGTTISAPDVQQTEIDEQIAADRKAIASTLAAVREAADAVRLQHAERLHDWQKAAVELALTIAARILHERVTAEDFPIETMVRDMAAEMADDELVCVRLNPRDLQLLERRLDGEPLFPGQAEPRVIADATLGRAECRMEGRTSVALSDLTRHLTQIREDLLGKIAHART